MNKKIVIIEGCNYINYPIGGHLSFAKQMLNAFGNEIALVGIVSDNFTPIGKWSKKIINNIEFDYFAVKKITPQEKKGIIPGRIISYLLMKKYKSAILEYGSKNLFIQTPEVFFVFKNEPNLNICLRLPGLGNPLRISRYFYAKLFSSIYEKFFFISLNKARILLAAADKNSIRDFINKGNKYFDENKIIQFPTRYDEKIFFPRTKSDARSKLNLPQDVNIIITTGRLNYFKGWKFMIDAFIIYKTKNNNSKLLFLGDGEDKIKIQKYIAFKNLSDSILLMGKFDSEALSEYLNSADIFISGSLAEGWSTSLVEAVATGLPICTTNFSSAKEIVEEGINGFVVDERNEQIFADKMSACNSLERKDLLSKAKEIRRLAVSNLKTDIQLFWNIK